MSPDIEAIKARHEAVEKSDMARFFYDAALQEQAHDDRATLLRYLDSELQAKKDAYGALIVSEARAEAALVADSELTAALKPFKAWCAACMKAAPLAPDDMIWAGYQKAAITMGDMRILYFALRALTARDAQ